MPIYEEKLISPLAIRFTQDHIKTTFRDGRSVEAAIDEIYEQPGVGGYDAVLGFPFPAIEILRWRSPFKSRSRSRRHNDEHWFTLDNRRLYCLQRAAINLWPKRVGVAVELLYADNGSVRRKLDSISEGTDVTISHSIRDPPLRWWDWRKAVEQAADVGACCPTSKAAAFDAVQEDDHKATVDALTNVPVVQSSNAEVEQTDAVASFIRGALLGARGPAMTCVAPETGLVNVVQTGLEEEGLNGFGDPPTPSTADASSTSDEDNSARISDSTQSNVTNLKVSGSRWVKKGSDVPTEEPCHGADARPGFSLPPEADKMQLEAQAILEISSQLRAPGNVGRIWVPHWNQRFGWCFGGLRAFLEAHPNHFAVDGRGGQFTVSLVGSSEEEQEDGDCWLPSDLVAQQAIQEIEAQLSLLQANFVWVENWNGRYRRQLGPLRKFMESRPDRFVVVPGKERGYSVYLAQRTADPYDWAFDQAPGAWLQRRRHPPRRAEA